MIKGKVKWYNYVKGYGFIKSEDGEDIFVHRSGLSKSLYKLDPDQEVEYDTGMSEKGKVAIDVRIVSQK